MRKQTKTLGLLFCLTAFSSEAFAEKNNSGINSQYMDKSVSPQDDFYNYANGSWIKNTQIPDDENRWGGFLELRKNALNSEVTIIDELAKNSSEISGENKKIYDLYLS